MSSKWIEPFEHITIQCVCIGERKQELMYAYLPTQVKTGDPVECDMKNIKQFAK